MERNHRRASLVRVDRAGVAMEAFLGNHSCPGGTRNGNAGASRGFWPPRLVFCSRQGLFVPLPSFPIMRLATSFCFSRERSHHRNCQIMFVVMPLARLSFAGDYFVPGSHATTRLAACHVATTRRRFTAGPRTRIPNSRRFRIARRSFLSRACIAARFLSYEKFGHSPRFRRKQHSPAP